MSLSVKKRKGANNLSRQIKYRELLDEKVLPPPGLELSSEEETQVWQEYAAVRAPDMWRPADLRKVYQLVKIQMAIRQAQENIAANGVFDTNDKGLLTPSVALRALTELTGVQLKYERALGINALYATYRDVNNDAQKLAKVKEKVEEIGTESLYY